MGVPSPDLTRTTLTCTAHPNSVCSQAGKLSQVSKKLQARVSAADATRDTLTAVAKEFVASVADGTSRAQPLLRTTSG